MAAAVYGLLKVRPFGASVKSRDYYLGRAREMLRLAQEAQTHPLHQGWLKAAAAFEALAEKAAAPETDGETRE